MAFRCWIGVTEIPCPNAFVASVTAAGTRNYNTSGTFVDSVTAPASTFTPTSIAGGNGNLIVVRGSISFTANNEDSRSLIEILGSTLKDVDDTLRGDPVFFSQWQDAAHPEFRVDANSGFEEQLPEPSSALLAAIGSAAMLLRRRRQNVPSQV